MCFILFLLLCHISQNQKYLIIIIPLLSSLYLENAHYDCQSMGWREERVAMARLDVPLIAGIHEAFPKMANINKSLHALKLV